MASPLGGTIPMGPLSPRGQGSCQEPARRLAVTDGAGRRSARGQAVVVTVRMGRAMRQRWISSLGAVALALVSCGVAQGTPTAGTQPSRTPSAAPTPTATPTPTPTATAAPAGTLASCVGAAPASSPPATGPLIAVEPASGETVELVDMAGSVLEQTPIQPFDGVMSGGDGSGGGLPVYGEHG